MTGRITRIAALGAGAVLALGFFTAAPAGASDGAQTDANVQVGTADVVSQTLGLVNQACADAGRLGGAATSALASADGISVASNQAGTGLNLAVSLPALSGALPGLGSLPLSGAASGHVDAAPLTVNCAAASDGTGLGLSAAGVTALVNAIAPGVDLSGIDLPAGVSVSAGGGAAAPATSASGTASAAPAGSAAGTAQTTAQSPTVRASASAPVPSTTAAVTATPASASNGIIAQVAGSPGALARTGAGVSALALLGSLLFGSGRFLALGRKLLRAG